METVGILPQWKFVTWTCTTTCTYSCSYCTPEHHNGKYRWIDDYSTILEFTNNFRQGFPLVFDIMGGEPTLWPKLNNFCNDLVKHSDQTTAITFTTNGNRSLNYWKKFTAPIDVLGFSFHPEFSDENHFLEIFSELHQRYRVLCYILMRPQDYERSKMFFKKLDDSGLEINVIVKLISDWHHGTGIIPGYTEEMIDFSLKQLFKTKIKSKKNFTLTLDGEETDVRTLINSKRNNYYGWNCYAGRDYVNIGPDGKVSGSSCGLNDNYGNIYNGTVNIPKTSMICTKQYCSCGTDLEIFKVKN